MAMYKLQEGSLIFREGLKKVSISAENIVWAYLQVEDVKAGMCCGTFNTCIGRLIFQDNLGKRHSLQFEGTEIPEKLLSKLTELNPDMAVGFTEENKIKFSPA